MKKLITYLKALWRRGLDSQRKEVGVISGEATIEHPFSTHSAPFGTCWQPSGKLHWVVRCAAMLVMLFTIGSGNVWGLTSTVTIGSTNYPTAKTGTTVSGTGDLASTWNVTVVANYFNGNDNGIHAGSNSQTATSITLTSSSFSGKTITAISVTGRDANTTQSNRAVFTAKVNGSAFGSTSRFTTSSNTYTASGSVACTGNVSVEVVRSSAVTKAIYVSAVSVTFSNGSSTTYTVTYNLNGGTGTTPTESAKAAGAEFTLHNGTTGITPPTGKIFSKWRDQDSNDFSGGATYTMPAKNVTLTAQWIDEPSCDYDAATSLNVGDEIIIVIPASSKQMKAINSGGEVVDYPNACPDEELIFTVEEGYGGSDLALKTSDDKYLSWSSSTTVQLVNSVTSTNQNWTAETVGGVLLLKNLGDGGGARYLLYYNNTNMRLYRDAGQASTVKPTIYVLNGCEPLGSVSGSITSNTPASVTLSWSAVTGAEKYQVKVPGSSSHNAWTDVNTTSVTVTKSCGTAYTAYFRAIDTNGTHCSTGPESTTAVPAVSYTVTSTGVTNATASPAIPSTTCSGFSTTISPATGYALPADITVTNATKSWNSSTGALSISNVTGNVSITITPTCVSPVVTADPADANYYVGDSPEALLVTATLASGTRTYLWKVSTNGGSTWSDAAGTNNAATYSGASLSTASAGTLKFKCIVGNSQGGCTVESGVATITVSNASYFTNGVTVFIQADSKDYSAWKDDACVKAWFNASGAGGAAQTTYWLFDATDTDAGKKLFAAVVPASGNLNQVTVQRFAEGCGSFWNDNGTLTQASSGGVNTLHSYGSADNNIAWNGSSTTLSLYGSQNSWASSLATFTDQGSGVWTASFNNYAPDATSKDYKIKTSYNNGWIGNTGSNNNATLSGMIVGSTYNVTATLNVTTHALTMSKTFVKGEVSFDLQGHGSSIADLTNITAGSKISAPGTPSATGYDFGGWYKEPACTNAWDFANDVVNETMTLYAKWTKHTYTITSTLNNCSSSPAIPSSYEYTGSAASLSYTITPSSGYRLPTTITVSGTTYTWNSTTGALVLTGTIASNVTITISAVQTHTVDWYVGGSAPANKIDDDGQTTVVDHGGKIEDFPATTPDGSACDKEFVGWTNTSSYVHGTSPLFNDVAGSPTINADASFYAVFAEVNSVSASLTKMTADDDLEVGDKIVIIAQDTRYGMYQASASSYVSYWTTADGDGEPSLSEIEADDKKYLDVAAGSASNTWKLGDATNGYLYNASSTNLEFSTTNSSDLTLIAWTDHSFTFVAGQEVSCRTDITGANANKWRGAGASCDPEEYTNCSGTPYYYLYKYVPSSTTATGHTIICADCGTSVTPTYTAAPTGGTVSVTKSAAAVASGSTVKTCTSVDLTVTITPASHYTLTGFTATGLSTGTATISPAVGSTLPKTTETTFTVTVSAGATGTLNLTPTFTEDAHKVISWVVHGSSASIADGHGTTWVYSGEDLTAIPTAPDAPTGCDDKVFVGWSENDGGATEEDASYYDDRFTTLGEAPTGITTDKTFTAVFATPAAGLGGTVMWDEPWTGYDNGDQPASKSGYNSATISYAYGESGTKVYAGADQHYAGGTQPELMVVKSGGTFTASNIPTAGQTSLTLTYKTNYSANVTVTSGTSGVTVSDPDVSGTTCTRTITISQSPATNNFALTFTMTKSDKNARLDDINIAVPGSSSMSGYVTTCEDTWTVTYYKNTEDAVTNLPSPTGISKSTGSGTLSSKVPVRYGYTFDGWAISAGGSVAYAAGAAVSSVSADMDLYAKWSVTPVTEINLSKTSLDKYVGDPSVILSVLSVLPDGANTSVTWSSSNPSVATVNSTTGEVNFVAEGTANIIATSTITSGITATCAVTVWAKPSVSFLDNLHSLTEDKDGNALSGYNITDVAGTPVVFPVLANQPAGSGTCEDEFYVFVGWTTSDNNTDPEDHLVTSHNLTNGDNITYYAVWANGVSGTTYTKLTSSTFKTSPTKYVLGAAHADSGTEHYFYSCDKTDKNNSWGYVTADLASNTPIEFTLSGTAAALVATSTEVSARYLKPLADKDFQMSASSQTVELKSDGTIYNNNTGDTSWRLLYNKAGGLRWYSSNVSGSTNAYFYEVVAGGEVNYRTSCCADKVAAPSVTATKTSTTVTLTWAAVSGATGYELQWNGGAWTAATSGVVKSDLTPNTNYSWRVRATYDPPKCGADIASGSTTTNQVYHVTYAKGSGTGSCNATGSTTDGTAYEAGATVTLQSNGFTLVGHTFNEWTEDDDDITISSNQFTMPEHDVVITATWTPKVDKFYDRMHDGTDASHGGIRDGDGKYYITREGCSYTVPSLTDNTSGATACHTKHYVLMGWTAENHLNSDGTLKTGHEGYVYTGGGTQTATGATYYAVWAEVEE